MPDAARKLNIGKATVERARAVLASGSPLTCLEIALQRLRRLRKVWGEK